MIRPAGPSSFSQVDSKPLLNCVCKRRLSRLARKAPNQMAESNSAEIAMLFRKPFSFPARPCSESIKECSKTCIYQIRRLLRRGRRRVRCGDFVMVTHFYLPEQALVGWRRVVGSNPPWVARASAAWEFRCRNGCCCV